MLLEPVRLAPTRTEFVPSDGQRLLQQSKKLDVSDVPHPDNPIHWDQIGTMFDRNGRNKAEDGGLSELRKPL